MELKLVPNPFRSGSISRAVLFQSDQGETFALDVDAIFNNPKLIKPFNPGYMFAIRFWKLVSTAIVLAGVYVSVTWHWWAFLPASLLAYLVHRGNQKSAGDFALQAIYEQPEAAVYFADHQLLWPQDAAKAVKAW